MEGLRFVRTKEKTYFSDCLHEFQMGFQAVVPEATICDPGHLFLSRLFLRAFWHTYDYFPNSLFRMLGSRSDDSANFAVQMGLDFVYIFPRCFRSRRNFIYVFDAWPRGNKILSDLSDIFNIERVFISSLQAEEHFNSLRGDKKGVWIPEGIMPDDYSFYPYRQKDIDVMEFGRRYEPYHVKIKDCLAKNRKVHVFKEDSDSLLYKSKQDLCNALARSKISICVPSDITHPGRAEFISTMTLRYLQSMLSKCLIVGVLPYDMQYLFDHNPVIQIDGNDPEGQILGILSRFDDYIPLIEENYASCMKNHLWTKRVQTMIEYMDIPQSKVQ